MKLKIEDIEKLLNGELDTITPQDGEFMTYQAIKQGLGGALGLINKIIKRYTQQPSLFHWVYLSAMRELFIMAAKQLQSQPNGQGVYVVRIIQDEKAAPALEIALCSSTETENGLLCKTHQTYTPHTFIYRGLDWYEKRTNPSTDIAKLWIMASRKTAPTPPAP